MVIRNLEFLWPKMENYLYYCRREAKYFYDCISFKINGGILSSLYRRRFIEIYTI